MELADSHPVQRATLIFLKYMLAVSYAFGRFYVRRRLNANCLPLEEFFDADCYTPRGGK